LTGEPENFYFPPGQIYSDAVNIILESCEKWSKFPMRETKATNIGWAGGVITRQDREIQNGNLGVILWLTGFSGSGKTTLAVALEKSLFERGNNCYRLDGDNIRHGLCSDLGFTPIDRDENIRRIGEVAKLFADAGFVAISSFISPYRSGRDEIRQSVARETDFVEVYVDCPLEVCEERDPKGLYQKARAGKIPDFTGISAPYEPPLNPEIVLKTSQYTVEECVQQLLDFLEEKGYLKTNPDRKVISV
jgi:adenylylsulfate kinase